MPKTCKHTHEIKFSNSKAHVCEECVKMGAPWVHLRLCMICGHVGCDSSKNKHATKHFYAVGHPLIRSPRAGRGLNLVLRRRGLPR